MDYEALQLDYIQTLDALENIHVHGPVKEFKHRPTGDLYQVIEATNQHRIKRAGAADWEPWLHHFPKPT